MPSKRNIELYEELGELVQKYGSNIVFVDFTGADVATLNSVRKEIKAKGGYYKVVKNTIGYRFFKESFKWDYPNLFLGVNALVFLNDDNFFDVLKYFVKLEKDSPFKIKSSIFEGKPYGREETIQFSKMSSKKEILAQFVGVLNSGVSSFVYTINNVVQGFVSVLKAIEDKKQ
ncbi:MAG: 50S ribosomal protein L10 [Brevinematia bacterium]